MKTNNKTTLKYYIITSALIWAATIIGCALILKQSFSEVSILLTIAAASHLILIWPQLAAQLKKQSAEECAETGIKG